MWYRRTYELREQLVWRNKIMTVTRGIAAAAMFAGLAVGTASTAWADTTMSGHYIATETNPPSSQVTTRDWYFTPCGNGCAQATGGSVQAQARLVNGQWTMQVLGQTIDCDNGRSIPNAVNSTYTWDQNTLAGTVQKTLIAQGCYNPSGYSYTTNLQFRQAP
jgi:hypothetical protein